MEQHASIPIGAKRQFEKQEQSDLVQHCLSMGHQIV